VWALYLRCGRDGWRQLVIYGGSENWSEDECEYWAAQVEEAEEIRDRKYLHGLKVLAALREHPYTDSFGTRRCGQHGQG
jgi:hypothetical protein